MFRLLDLGSLESVSTFAATYVATGKPLHILVNNAGIMATPLARTTDGFESQQTQCIAYGPVPLVIQDASTSYLNLSFYRDFTLSGDLSHAITPASGPMTFTTNGYPLAPFYNADTKPYHVYFHRSEPEIVFGGVDSGVQNYAEQDGLTFLDIVWARAPFSSPGQFRYVVGQISAQWVSKGLLTSSQRDSIVAAAAQANLGKIS